MSFELIKLGNGVYGAGETPEAAFFDALKTAMSAGRLVVTRLVPHTRTQVYTGTCVHNEQFPRFVTVHNNGLAIFDDTPGLNPVTESCTIPRAVRMPEEAAYQALSNDGELEGSRPFFETHLVQVIRHVPSTDVDWLFRGILLPQPLV